MKLMLAEQEKLHPKLFASLLTAMKPQMGIPPDR
jgi:tRNA 2-thiocytidine biosynthesis protein TtcA